MKQRMMDDYARIPDRVSEAYVRSALNLKEEPMKKRRVSLALILAIVLILVAVTAVATVLLGGREFVQEVMQPKAQENDSDRWSEEDVQEILRIAQENGLSLDEAQQARLLSMGGYYKEELMRLFMKLDLGKYPSTWSIEDQAWYGQMLVDIGMYEETYSTLPEAGEATEEEMLLAVQNHVHAQYDPQAALADETIYRRHTTYQWTPSDTKEEALEKQWYVEYEPLDLVHPGYRFALDADANILSEWMEPGIAGREEQPTPAALRYRYEALYGNFYEWEMETFVDFQRMLRAAAAVHGFGNAEVLELLSHAEFALAQPGAKTKDMAMDAAMAAVMARENLQASALQRSKAYAVYLLGEEAPVWKVTLPGMTDGDYVVEVNALTGEVRNSHFIPFGADSIARNFMLESVYQEQMKKARTQPGALRLDNRSYQAVEPLPDGGFLLVGSAWRRDDITQAWAARINADGTTRWEVFSDEGRTFHEAVAMSDGTYLLAMEPMKGEAFSLALVSLDADGRTLSGPLTLACRGWAYKGKDCMLVAKYHESDGINPSTLLAVSGKGETLWEHTYDALLGSGFHPLAAADGYLLSGGAQGYPYDQQSGIWGMMARLDDQGNLLWVSRMDDYPQTGISAQLETGDGGMYGAGMNFGKYEDDAEDYQKLSDFVVRFDADGNVLWCRYYPELDPVHGVLFDRLLPAPDDGVLVLARSLEGNDWHVVHLSGEGSVQAQWQPQPEIKDFVRVNAFEAGGQRYMIYCNLPDYAGTMGPVNTYITPLDFPETI